MDILQAFKAAFGPVDVYVHAAGFFWGWITGDQVSAQALRPVWTALQGVL